MTQNINLIPPALTGTLLKDALAEEFKPRDTIIESILYEHTCLMIAADPGLGKSTVARQIAIEVSTGVNVFGYFHVPKPCKVYYIQAERDISEGLQHFHAIQNTIPINHTNLHLCTSFQTLSLLKESDIHAMVSCIERDCPEPDIIVIDPIYSTIPGGLSKDEAASMFTRAIRLIQYKFKCSLILNHHTVKNKKDSDGATKTNPFYGAVWLEAFITGSFYLHKRQPEGVILTNVKDNYKLLANEIQLEYNGDTELCNVVGEYEMSASDRFKHYLELRKLDKKAFTFSDIIGSLRVSHATLRRLLCDTPFSSSLISDKGKYGKKIYKAI